ncbi:hypothetical protein T281_17290 [Rhodomicrobium udaipurense JA643]|uniref:Uncharacterized protein n=1 Tax=Rhodomicrobium udaipurense TaxID=1202716 RepID=A0A8I1KI05_9HYPH|nr:hypothetical protein [Rhodomicrobium udaipurense]KAI93343.1 hypothetical protein T281_17290 [Rhodomicrobium udaipurense JA643]MBJ7544240.1 hypothetical protein [Rhodomicrobium udaipurense]
MASLSPNTVAINTIAHNLANAADAVAALDAAISEELRALIRLANAEIVRVRKAARKAAATAKRTAAAAAAAAATVVEPKQPARRGRKPKAKVEAVAAAEVPAIVEVAAVEAIAVPAEIEVTAAQAIEVSGAPIEIPAAALELSAVLVAAAPKARGRRRKTAANGMTAH